MNSLDSCPVCGQTGEGWADVADRHYGNAGTWHVDRCTACRALYLDPMPTEAELGTFYPTEYYSHQPVVSTASSWKARLKRVVLPLGTGEPTLGPTGRMLDVGSGSGWMLDVYRARGWEAEGVEYSESACQEGSALGRTMHRGSLLEAELPSASFDYVRSNHSFEHLNNPHETLDEMSRLLRPGGTLFIGVPDSKGLMARVFGPEWYYVGAPVHVINYDRDNLAELIEQHGFAVTRRRGNSNHGGTIGSLQSWFIKRRGSGSLGQGMVTSAPFILVGFWLSRLLDLFRLGDCVEITAVKTPAGDAAG